jgi:hypothetical protein
LRVWGSPGAWGGAGEDAGEVACTALCPPPPLAVQLANIKSFILMEAKEKADEIRMKVTTHTPRDGTGEGERDGLTMGAAALVRRPRRTRTLRSRPPC